MEGEVKGEMVPHFLVQNDAKVSQWYVLCIVVVHCSDEWAS